MQRLTGRHCGETAWIIGKGASLEFLTRDHIGPGPVIAINQSIVLIESMRLGNPVYSMQKDGGVWREGKASGRLDPFCEFSGACCDQCEGMVRPKRATLLLHEHESKFCFLDYHDRIIFDFRDFGLFGNTFSLAMAVKIAERMGCVNIKLIACDVHATGEQRTFTPGVGVRAVEMYEAQIPILKRVLWNVDHEFITPVGEVAA